MVVLEILNDAVPLFVKLRGYPTENENPRGRKPRGATLSAWPRTFTTRFALSNCEDATGFN